MVRKRILWLASWYPNRYDKFNGDFIQRHAQAVSIDNDIYVIHLQDAGDIIKTEEEVHHQTGLTEQIIYYKRGRGIIGKALKQLRYFTIYKNAIKAYIKEYGLPHSVHVHVPWKAGLMALWMKRRYGVGYVVTEHWDIYNKIVEDNYFTKPIYFKKLLAQIIIGAEKLLTVSNFIGNSINALVAKKEFVFVPNVVDTNLFYHSSQKYEKFTFLHVSNMVDKKNVEGILKAFLLFLREINDDVQLILVGNTDEYYINKARELGLDGKNVIFRGEVPYIEVAKEMRKAHCFVLNSKIENSPCVIGEALCCGIPVITTKVGGIPELVSDDNSILIEPQCIDELIHALKAIYFNFASYSSANISEGAGQKFGYNVVGKQFDQIYYQVKT